MKHGTFLRSILLPLLICATLAGAAFAEGDPGKASGTKRKDGGTTTTPVPNPVPSPRAPAPQPTPQPIPAPAPLPRPIPPPERRAPNDQRDQSTIDRNYDTNGDGVISKAERKRMKEIRKAERKQMRELQKAQRKADMAAWKASHKQQHGNNHRDD